MFRKRNLRNIVFAAGIIALIALWFVIPIQTTCEAFGVHGPIVGLAMYFGPCINLLYQLTGVIIAIIVAAYFLF